MNYALARRVLAHAERNVRQVWCVGGCVSLLLTFLAEPLSIDEHDIHACVATCHTGAVATNHGESPTSMLLVDA